MTVPLRLFRPQLREPTRALPAAFVPMKLPRIASPVPPAVITARWQFPAITLPSPAPRPPISASAVAARDTQALAVVLFAAAPVTSVPM